MTKTNHDLTRVQESANASTAKTNEEAKGQRCARHNEKDCPMPDCEQEE